LRLVRVPKYLFVAKKHSNVGTTREALGFLITAAVKLLHGRY
jgi:hypothetical protein